MGRNRQLIVLDLEATCWPRPHTEVSEVIEIGAVRMFDTGEIADEFAVFVKPKLYPQLSDFCRELTTIEQADINQASSFPQEIQNFQDWIQEESPEYVLCSWGFYDQKQLMRDCQLHGLETEWLTPHISVKHQYAKLHSLKRPIGMSAALRREGMELIGTHHRGIDDARNIARIVQRYMAEWNFDQIAG